jgi:hypothetical protein
MSLSRPLRLITRSTAVGVSQFHQPGLFTMRVRRHGESLFHWGIVSGLWFRQVTYDVKLTNLQNLPPRPENRFKGKTRRLSS